MSSSEKGQVFIGLNSQQELCHIKADAHTVGVATRRSDVPTSLGTLRGIPYALR